MQSGANGTALGAQIYGVAEGTATSPASGGANAFIAVGKSIIGGDVFGGNPIAWCMTVACRAVVGLEIDTDNRINATAAKKALQLVDVSTSSGTVTAASNIALHILAQTGAYGFEYAFVVGDAASQFPIRTTGTILVTSAGTVATGVNLSALTITGNAFVSSGFSVSGGGVLASSSGAFNTFVSAGVNGALTGQLRLLGATSGTAIITPQVVAGAPTLTIGTTSGTITASATSPLAIDSTTGVISISSIPLASLATQATNTVVGNATSGTAVPIALAVGSCSTAASALIWTTNTGFGCNTSITAAAVPASGLTGTTLAASVVTSSLTSVGTLGSLTVTNTITAATFNASVAFQLSGVTAFNKSGNYHIFSDPDAVTAILIGNTVDPTMYFDKTTSKFRAIGGGITFLTIDATSTNAGQTTASTSKTTGALKSGGGLGVVGATFTDTLNIITVANASTTAALCWNSGTGLVTENAAVGTCTVSDERLKNMGPRLTGSLDKLLKINGVYFTWKDPQYGSGKQIGVGAQTVAKVFPELVSTDGEGKLSADYQRLTAPIIEALREVDARLGRLEGRRAK